VHHVCSVSGDNIVSSMKETVYDWLFERAIRGTWH
jgi:hypothetical protein